MHRYDLNSQIAAALDIQHPGSVWDVVAGEHSPPDQIVCREYPGALAAHNALLDAGYAVTSRFVAAPKLDGADTKTILRYQKGLLLVLLARRRDATLPG